MIDRIQKFVEQQRMIEKGDHVIVGVSGGADSVCLLRVLCELRPAYDLKLTVLHVEHGIRGEDSVKDMMFVKRLCASLEIECHCLQYDIPEMAKTQGLSEEEMGRNVRYEAFHTLGQEIGATKIAVAHHGDDVAETMLFFLCRGTGIAGLCPIRPIRGKIIRPLLCVTREEIEAYLAAVGQDYCVDITNFDTDYTRNKLRHKVIPVLKEVNSQSVQHFGKTAQNIMEAQEVLEKEVGRSYKDTVEVRENGFLIKENIEKELSYVKKQVVKQVLSEVAESSKDITTLHIEGVIGLFQLQVGRRIDLPYQMFGIRTYEGVQIRKKEENSAAEELWQSVVVPGKTFLPNGRVIETKICDKTAIKSENLGKTYTKWMDYDIIKNDLCIRQAQPEDYMVIDACGNRKKIKKLFVDEKIPRENRNNQMILASGSQVFWVVGVRMSEDAKVTPSTKRMIEITIYEGDITHE